MLVNKREYKGIEFVLKGLIKPVSASKFMVRSESSPDLWYTVKWDKKRWICSCMDFTKHRKKCKHIYGLCYYLTLQDLQIGVQKIGEDKDDCPICGSSEFVIKDGFSETRSGLVQRYFCKRCKHGFTAKTGFEGAHGQAFAIILSLDLYYRGVSLRQISQHFESVYGIKISHGTIYGWIKRYVKIVSQYVSRLKLKTGSRWHIDETVLRVRSKHLVLWSMLDGESRRLLAQHISESKSAEEACKLLEEGLKRSRNRPLEMVSDAAPATAKAIDKIFGDDLKYPLIHVQAAISTPLSNNKIERFHKTLKQRFKTISSFHSQDTAKTFSEGYTIFYNYIKKHASLDGKTPIEATDTDKSEDSWVKLIQKARKKQR